ncbi:MAG TPA: hypothetical protein VFD05_04915 [Bacilli bacterium]|nr:hypothetical protein [Bacilli bacterium]
MNNAILNQKKLSELLALIRAEENYYIDFTIDLDYEGEKDLVIKKSNQEFYDYVKKYTTKYVYDEIVRTNLISTKETQADEFEQLVIVRGLLYMAFMNEKGLALADWERLVNAPDDSLYYITIQVLVRAVRKRPGLLAEVGKLYPDIFVNEETQKET